MARSRLQLTRPQRHRIARDVRRSDEVPAGSPYAPAAPEAKTDPKRVWEPRPRPFVTPEPNALARVEVRPFPPVGRDGNEENPIAVWTMRQDGKDVLYVRNVDGGTPLRLGTLETIPANTPLFHWNADSVMRQWTQNGGVPIEEMERRLLQNMHSMGGGVYVSLNPADCQQFGRNLMVFSTPRPFRVVRYERLMGEIEGSLQGTNPSERPPVTRITLNRALLLAGSAPDGEGALAGSYSVAPGAQTAGLPSTWMNILRSDVLGPPRVGTLADIAPLSPLAAARTPTDAVRQLLHIDATKNIDVRAYAALPDAHPLLARWLVGEPLSPTDRGTLWAIVRPALQAPLARADDPIVPRTLFPQRSRQPLLEDLWRTFGAEIEHELSASMTASGTSAALSLADAIPLPSQASRAAAALGGLDERFKLLADIAPLMTDARRFGLAKTLPAPPFLSSPQLDREVDLRDAFGKRLLAALALGNPHELGTAMSRLASPFDVQSLVGLKVDRFDAIRRSGIRLSPGGVQAIHAALTAQAFDVSTLSAPHAPRGTDFRGAEAWEEGDINVAGKRYLRIRADERDALLANPFVTPEFQRDPSSPDGATVLARWAYPSASSWRRFAQFLPEGLTRQLEKAGDLTQRPQDAEHFTRLIVLSLLDAGLAHSHVARSPSLCAQLLASIRPFDTGNEAVMRTVIARLSTQRAPALIADPRSAVLQSPDAFALTIDAGRRRFEHALLGLGKIEETEPANPRFYESPELWQALLDQPARADASRETFTREPAPN